MPAPENNPHSPTVLGEEWLVTRQYGFQLGDVSAVMGILATAPGLSIIDQVIMWFSGATALGTGLWHIEVFDGLDGGVHYPYPAQDPTFSRLYTPILYGTPATAAGEATTTGQGCIQLCPTQDAERVNVIGSPDNADLYTNVDSLVGTSTGGQITFSGNNSSYTYVVGSAAYRVMPGRQVTEVLVGVGAAYGSPATTLTAILIIDGVEYAAAPWQGNGTAYGQNYWASWPLNPSTGFPWTSADIDKFANNSIEVKLRQNGAAAPHWAIYQTAAYVNFVEEKRVALTVTSLLPVLNAWSGGFVDAPTYYNMLHTDEASFETTVGGWSAGANTSQARSNSQAYQGTWSLRLTSTAVSGTNDISAHSDHTSGDFWPIPVVAGHTYNLKAAVRAATTSRNAHLTINWLDADLVAISSTTGSSIADVNTDWTQAVIDDAVAPALSAFCYLTVTFESVAAGEQHYVDAIELIYTPRPNAAPDNIWPDDPFILGGATGRAYVEPGTELFTVIYKLPGGNGGPSLLLMDSGDPIPRSLPYVCYLPTLGSPSGWLTAVGDPQTFAFGFMYCDLTTGGDPLPTLSQQYAFDHALLVDDVTPQQQLFEPTLAQDYGFIRVVCSTVDGTTTAPLTIKVWDEVANAQIGPDLEITIDQLSTPKTAAQVASVQSPTPIPIVNTGFDAASLRFSTTDTSGWYVYALMWTGDPNDEGANIDTITATIATLPDAPACFDVVTV